MKPVIYQIRNTINGKCYIGSTINQEGRFKKHLYDLKAGRHHSPILQYAFNKYGESAFDFEVIEEVEDPSQLAAREQHYLNLRPQYNASYIAGTKTRLGMKSSPEHCARMSAALIGRVSPNKGKKHSDEHRRKISEALKGKQNCLGRSLSTETRRKLSVNHNPKSNAPRSEATKAKCSINSKKWHETKTAEQEQAWIQKILTTKAAKGFFESALIQCKQCAQTFSVQPYRKATARYCSFACKEKATKKPVTLTCERCHKTYTVKPSRAGKSKYCSNACYWK